MTLTKQINTALKKLLYDRFDIVDYWPESEDGFAYRLVFELAPEQSGVVKRSLRYVVIAVEDNNIIATAQNRNSIQVDYAAPDSIETLEEFIEKNCIKQIKRRRPCSSIG